MRLFPVLIDDRPAYLSGSPPLSLLLLPLGAGTVLGRLRAEVVRHARHRIVVVTRFEPDPDYFAALAALGIRGEDVHSEAAFAQQLGRYEPSDCLLIRDSRRLGAQLLDLGGILADGPVSSRSSRHLVWHAGTSAGTNERILVDASGRVSRIQRYYENVTWPFASGVACSLVPVASVWSLPKLAATRLVELRASLSAAGVQSTDSHLEVSLFDLGTEAGLLAANEASISASTVSSPPASATIDPTALVRGAVLVGENVVVESRALVIGPCVLADGSRVGHGAVVAQCVLTTGASVLPGEVTRQRLVIEGRPARSAEVGDFEPLDAFDPTASGELDQELRLPVGFALQRAVEAALSLVALLVLFPLMAFLALLVKLESRGPAFFSHLREGRFGRTFRCWKFRTMQVNADVVQHELEETNQVDGPQFKIHRDPRVTRVGLWLRRLNLDETPQLFNVLKGEMSLVGPRPSPFRENQLCIPWREARLSVRPGITGLWQVCRNDRSSGDFHQWIYYDLLYVEHMSWWLDLKILVATVTSLGGHFPVPLSRLLPPAKFHDRRGASRPAETSAEVRARRMLLDRRERVELLGCEFDPCNLQSAIDRCIEWCRGPRLSHTVITLNAALLCQMRRDAELRQACRRGDLILADGMPVVWTARLAGVPLPERVAGVDLMARLLEAADAHQLRVFFLGARKKVLLELVRRCTRDRPALVVAGARDGYFGPSEHETIVAEIRKAAPHLLFVGMPSPFKETWCEQHREALGVPVIMGVGGSFDVLAGRVRRAPRVLQSLGLEWSWRLAMEPRKMWKRYLVTNSEYLFRAAVEVITRRTRSELAAR